jgi:RNA polymerase sigma-70 factor (ECF subfamily)
VNIESATAPQVGTINFEEIFLPHLDAAYNLARWLTRNRSDAEDVVQEAYLRAFKFRRGFHEGDGRSWILKIVRNTSYTWMKKNRRPELLYELNEDLAEDKSKGAETHMLENDDRDMLRKSLKALPASLREVMVLRHIEGLSYKEIAALIEAPIGTVMSRLSRGRERLQKNLAVQSYFG